MNKIGIRRWLSFIIAGIVGQIAWAIENMYLNVYVFHCTQDYIFIPIMTAASAAVATITTLFMGALSDKLKRRKAFIAFGYILWGISIIAFAFLEPGSSASIVGVGANAAFVSGTLIVVMDCVMTFFGSTANDAAFNAFVTDNTVDENRGKVESVLSVLPMVSMIIIVVLQGMLVVENKGWNIFFYVFGGLVLVVGIVCIFLLPKDHVISNENRTYFGNIFYGFRPSVIKNNKLLYITFLGFLSFNIAIQIFFPYFMVYIQNVLGIVEGNFTITLGVVLVIACIITVVFGLFMDRIGKNKIIIPSLLVTAIGAFLFFIAKDMIFTIISGIVLMSGYMVTTAVIGAKIRDYTPKDETGSLQGIRMIFAVLLPMVTGPYIGEALFNINAQTYENEYGKIVLQPNNFMFLGVIFFLLLAIVPITILIIKEREAREQAAE
ncbi:MAG: MFS transporter [Bacilli bacterium]|nr:MFS transporter [Bacilli bacterium]